MIEKPSSYTSSEIASWQLNYDNSNVELPALQRGFVWKANQIESLWDSLLRGFPIGSFLMSKSEDEKLFLLDGQQRATSIAIGHYNPWEIAADVNNEESKCWSLKNIPVLWIDLMPSEKTNNHKFVLRVVTQSHPWGYQRKNNNAILSVPDRKHALNAIRENPENKVDGYTKLSPLNIYPYDCNLPVPLAFLIKSVSAKQENWKEHLIELCKLNLPVEYIKTKYTQQGYVNKLSEYLFDKDPDLSIFKSIRNLSKIEIPGITVKKEILKAENEQTNEDPTLFVRLNSSGTKIAGEELIYSIYKASFPEAKKLVEGIGAHFLPPSLVISLISRLVFSDLNNGAYPYPMNVTDFRKRIQDENFRNRLKDFIGIKNSSQATSLFSRAIHILQSESEFGMPPVLVKTIIRKSPDLLLMLLLWLKFNENASPADINKKILGTITGLAWFGRDNTKFVREIWKSIPLQDFWSRDILSLAYKNKKSFLMYPLIQPVVLRKFLYENVVEKNVGWNDLYPSFDDEISKQYKESLSSDIKEEREIIIATRDIWTNFINRLFWNKSLVLFAQRKFINNTFGDFNQIDTLEDTNSPWDWDHIYPDSWVSGKWYINPNTRHWTKSIGNFRAISLEQNRSENDRLSPGERLENFKPESFVKENDWQYWSRISGKINNENNEMIKNHLSAITTRLCNIYEEWYSTLNIGELFNFEPVVVNSRLIEKPVLYEDAR